MQEVIGSIPIFSTCPLGLKIFDILVQAKQNEEAQGSGLVFRESENEGKESKGAWWMPRLTEAMKDVISCDKPRLGANDP